MPQVNLAPMHSVAPLNAPGSHVQPLQSHPAVTENMGSPKHRAPEIRKMQVHVRLETHGLCAPYYRPLVMLQDLNHTIRPMRTVSGGHGGANSVG